MEEQKDYFSPSLFSLEKQESNDTYYIPKFQQTIEAGEYASEREIEINALKKMAGKNNNAFLMGMNNLDEKVPMGLFDGYAQRKTEERMGEFNSSAWEATKAGLKGFAQGPVRFIGYAATNSLPLIARTATTLYAMSGAAGGPESADKWLREANKGIEAWENEIKRATGIDDASEVESIVGNAIGSVWGSVAIGGTVGKAAVAPMFGVSALQDTYVRQREAGTGMGESLVRGAVHGTAETALESLQLNRIFGNLAKKSKPIAIVKDLFENALQEGTQQGAELATNWNIDNRELSEKLQEVGAAIVGGAVASLAGSVGGNILNRKTIDEVGDLMKKTGHTEEEIQTVKANLNKIADTDELEKAANMVAKDELTTIALTYKEQAKAASEEIVNQLDGAITRNELVDSGGVLGQPEDMPPLYQLGDLEIDTQKNPSLGMVLYQADKDGKPFQTLGQVLEWTKGKLNVEKAKQLSTGIGSVYTQTYEQLKGLGQDDTLADSNARIRSAMAFAIANKYGGTVEEANKALGGIVSQRASEFSKNGLFQMAGVNAKTANKGARQEAEKMSKEGKNPTEIWEKTMWMLDKDGKWKFEIDDSGAKIISSDDLKKYEESVPNNRQLSELYARRDELELKGLQGTKQYKDIQKRLDELMNKSFVFEHTTTLGELLDHKKLYEAYPELKSKRVTFKKLKDGVGGSYSYMENAFNLDEKMALDEAEMLSTLLHEVQHYIQRVEDFARGGSPEEFTKEVMKQIKEKEEEIFEKNRTNNYIKALQKYVTREQAIEIVDKYKELNDALIKELESSDEVSDDLSERVEKELNSLFKKYGISEEQAKVAFRYNEGAKRNDAIQSLDDPDSFYNRLLGEIEARNTQKRMRLTEEQRRALPPFVDREYAGEEIIANNNGGIVIQPKESPLFQSEQDDKDLVVYHNISKESLEKSMKLGGLPVPSLAITRKDIPFGRFGEISLVGNKEMIDPSNYKNEVYNRDVWSATFPQTEYKKPKDSAIKKFKNKFGKFFEKAGDTNDLSSFVYSLTFSPARAENEIANSLGMKLAYIETELGKEVEIPKKDFGESILKENKIDEQFVEDLKDVDINGEREDIKKAVTEAYRKMLDRKDYSEFGKYAERVKNMEKTSDKTFDENGIMYFGKADNLLYAAKKYEQAKGKSVLDDTALRQKIDDLIKDKQAYREWSRNTLEYELLGEPKIEVGRSLKEMTLQNIVDAMTMGETKNAQDSFVYGTGKVIAAGAKKLESIADIKLESGKFVSEEEEKTIHEKLTEDITSFSSRILKASNIPFDFNAMSAAHAALGHIATLKNPTVDSLQKALNKEMGEKRVYPRYILEEGVRIAEEVKGLARHYFEAKPQRAVMINEFSGAIVPTDSKYDDISKKLQEQGLKVVRSDNQLEAVKEFEDVFFQDEANPRGAYYNNTTYLFENANESTFVHEMSHAYMDVLNNLANNGNEQAKSDLEAISKWLGKKQGEAFTQADWERFARGFETYLREGKAPNEYLGGKGGVFERFKNWLLNIYAGIKSLSVTNEKGKQEPVKINNQIKQFYDEMLGGTDIDSVIDNAQKNEQALTTLQNKLQELSDIQQRLAEERAKLVRDMANNVKPESTWANVKDWGNNLWESARDLPANVLQSSFERLSKIDKRLGLLVQRAEQSQGLRIKRWTDQIKPFYEAFNKLSADDKAKVQFYLLNQQWGEVEDLIGQESTNAVRDMLKTIYDELIASGVEVGYRDNYFPRSVLDYDGLLQEMGLTYPQLRKEMEESIGKDATSEEQAEWLDKHIMGFSGGNVSTKGNKYTKERKLDLITDKMAQYYKPSMETLVNYVEGMAKLISMREAFGKDITYKESKESAEDSIGKIINKLFGENNLTKKQIDEVRQVLSALYLPNGMGNKFLQAMRQYGYATKLSYSTTIRQFADIGMMMKVNGVLNTLDALFHPDKRITLENLGIDPLGEEFNTSKKDIGGKIANFSTKWKGINWADAVMKNTFLIGKYKDLQNLAKNPDKFHEKYDALFGDETETLIKDLNDNNVSEPVKVLLFHEISKIQPISRSAMPTAYLSNPNGRVFYMFKTFSLHRAEYMVSELANDFRNDDLKKAGKDIMADVAVIGWEGLVELLIAFLKYGWQAFATKEVLDTFAGAGLGVIGLNKHQALQLTRGQVDDFFQQMVGLGTPIDDIAYLMRHYDEDDKLLRAFLPDMILEPLIAGPKPMSNKKKKVK